MQLWYCTWVHGTISRSVRIFKVTFSLWFAAVCAVRVSKSNDEVSVWFIIKQFLRCWQKINRLQWHRLQVEHSSVSSPVSAAGNAQLLTVDTLTGGTSRTYCPSSGQDWPQKRAVPGTAAHYHPAQWCYITLDPVRGTQPVKAGKCVSDRWCDRRLGRILYNVIFMYENENENENDYLVVHKN